ncbi:MAG: alanine--tRNA ligase, partial [Mangrovibacterium sp.]
KDNPLVIEIWNLVFIQFNRKADGRLEELPAKHVDTGMGFERLCMVLQGKKSNYDTDVFQSVIAEVGRLCGKTYGADRRQDVAMRVIADHLRAIAFAIADGQLPSNNKAGYVIRRILRRAVRYGYTFLGFRHAFLFRLVEVLKKEMGGAFPELAAQQGLIEKVIQEEEESFLHTLETGIRLLDEVMDTARQERNSQISGRTAFELYDTYGFPLDLTELILRENGLSVKRAEFDDAMAEQKRRSRNAAAMETGDWIELKKVDELRFLGYTALESDIRISRYRKVTQKNETFYQLVFDQTPFYGESGGQVGDTGYIESGGEQIQVLDTRKENNLTVHIVRQLPADPSVSFKAVVNGHKRWLTANNHTATHLLDQALREVLGTHVEQKGSLVSSDCLRFDFSHFQKVSREELARIQQRVNALIRQNLGREEMQNVPFNQAREMGAIALFGEKYGNAVRVIRFGDSVELCGGTHVPATGQIGLFIITSESAVSAGVRRIEAITAEAAEIYLNEALEELQETRNLLNNARDLKKSVAGLIAENARLQKQLENYARQAAAGLKQELKKEVRLVEGMSLIARQVEIDSVQSLKDLSFQLKGELDNLVLVLGTVIAGKPLLSMMISEKLVKEKKLDAGRIVREAARKMKGGGGGQPFYATAGGKDAAGIQAAIEKAEALVLGR